MVDVGSKDVTDRVAAARSWIRMTLAAADAIRSNSVKKGDALSVARIAAIQSVKQTSNLIPLCHVILIDGVEVRSEWVEPTLLEWTVVVRSTGKTGVEMEAMMGASIAALTVYDMCKGIDRTMEIQRVWLVEKSGGASGDFRRNEL